MNKNISEDALDQIFKSKSALEFIEAINSVENSSESLDHYNPAVNSPCWKGAPRLMMLEPRSDAAAKAGSFDSKSSCGYEVQHSDNICEPQKDHASLSKSTGDMYLKPSLKMQHLKVSTVTSEKKHSSETCVVDAGSNRNDPSRYGTSNVPFHGTEDALSSPASVEDASAKLTKLHKADSTPKIDVPMLVNTIHNLSDLLLFHSSNGSFELKEGDREALKDVILNLHRCLSKYSEQKIPTPESLFPQQGTSQYLAQLSEMFELY
uniref:Uncharacterized protein n=1 Tax=Fagus sylvatica TaxID=28930 RepID=A0A2N9FJI1_FAGSY